MTAPNVEVTDFKVHSPSVISATVGGVKLVTAHAPHAAADKEKLKEWWAKFGNVAQELREEVAAQEAPMMTMFCGDLNATPRAKKRTIATEMLEEFLLEHGLVHVASRFVKPEWRRITFTGTKGRRAELDAVLVDHRFASSMRDINALPLLSRSDHRLLVTNVLLKLKTRKAVVKGERPPDYTVLKDKAVAADFGQRVLQQTFVAANG